jgi:hypothetical protein
MTSSNFNVLIKVAYKRVYLRVSDGVIDNTINPLTCRCILRLNGKMVMSRPRPNPAINHRTIIRSLLMHYILVHNN